MVWIKKKRWHGFSLLELLISVSIIGLLSAIALPSYRDYVDRVDNALAAAGVDQVIQAKDTTSITIACHSPWQQLKWAPC